MERESRHLPPSRGRPAQAATLAASSSAPRERLTILAIAGALAFALALLASGAAAQTASTGTVLGMAVDAESGAPVMSAQVRLREINRGELSHSDGSFHVTLLAPGTYTISVQRIGYLPTEERVVVTAGDTTRVTLRMRSSALEVAAVVVTATGRERGANETYQPTSVISDAELRRRLGASIAATIAHEPGIHQRDNGPAAAQPVIRGMSGDRVLVLEDGQRTGDLSTTAPDHAVTIDPLTAERIEVVRGPAGLLYGSNALGGVINVIREEVPRTLPDRVSGTVSVQGESVNQGATAGAALLAPLGRFALRGELSVRRGGDVRTPLGKLSPTDMQGLNGSLGGSLITGWGFVGASVRQYSIEHGVPGEFGGEVIPGAHPEGVIADSRRRAARFEAGYLTRLGPFSGLQLDANIVQYLHDEIEGFTVDEGQPIVGSSFDQILGTVNAIARHDHEAGLMRIEGALGATYRGRDLIAGGSAPGLRSAEEYSLGTYVYEEFGLAPFRLQAGARYEWTRVLPKDTRPIVIGDRQVPVSRREFHSLSGSLAALFDMGEGWTTGISVARAFRTPAVEELFSDGPHLADYSFDIGNPALDAEIGLGADAFLRATLPRVQAEASVFRNQISNFIYHERTGELDPRFNRFPVFQARGDDAVFLGAEGRIQLELARPLVLDATLSSVRATRTATDDPLPAIPPVTGGLRLRYESARWFGSAGWDGAAAQNRVARPFTLNGNGDELVYPERPTPGYGLLTLGAGARFLTGSQFHTITLKVHNATDRVWHDHLSRVKEVAPQPGRNVQLLYRVQF